METTEGSLVVLDGSVSTDSDDWISSYQWTQVEGDPINLSDATSVATIFTAPKAGSVGKNLKFKLMVKDHGGLQGTVDNSSNVTQSQISSHSPSADFNYDVWKKIATFTDRSVSSNRTIVSWFWDFCDGETSTRQNPNHRYVKFDNYSVTLIVADNNGETDSMSMTVFVSD